MKKSKKERKSEREGDGELKKNMKLKKYKLQSQLHLQLYHKSKRCFFLLSKESLYFFCLFLPNFYALRK